MCHELGHLMMHRGVALSRIDPDAPPKIFCNSEWQADIFASYLLMPPELIGRFRNVAEVMDAFGAALKLPVQEGTR
jgi:Zn-dependent peptidase ImmA (M78 family)